MDLSQIEAKRIYLVCSQLENAQRLAETFVGQGFETVVAKDSQEMYKLLCEQPPGYVMISNELASGMGKVLPDFVLKRFGLPVLLVREHEEAPSLPSAASLPAEIHPVDSSDPHEMLRAVQNFETAYQDRLEGRVPQKIETAVGMAAPESGATEGPRLAEQVMASLREVFVGETAPSDPDEIMMLHACRVTDEFGESCLLLGFPLGREGSAPEEALVIIESRVREVAGAGATLEKITDQMARRDFEKLSEEASDRVQGRFADRDLILVYFKSVAPIEEMSVVEASELAVLVPLEDWWTELSLPCHAYVWMPLNQKRVLYVRPGHRLRVEAFGRFTTRGQQTLAVDPADLETFRRWRNLVRSLAKRRDVRVRTPSSLSLSAAA